MLYKCRFKYPWVGWLTLDLPPVYIPEFIFMTFSDRGWQLAIRQAELNASSVCRFVRQAQNVVEMQFLMSMGGVVDVGPPHLWTFQNVFSYVFWQSLVPPLSPAWGHLRLPFHKVCWKVDTEYIISQNCVKMQLKMSLGGVVDVALSPCGCFKKCLQWVFWQRLAFVVR